MDLSHDDIQQLLGAYALDAVDQNEREAVELHLRDCPRCRSEVASHREVAALLANTGAPAPEGVWDRIVESLEGRDAVPAMRLTVAPLPAAGTGTTSPTARRGPSPRTTRWLAGLTVAATIVVAVLGVAFVRQSSRLERIEDGMRGVTLARVAEDAQKDPDAVQVELASTRPGDELSASVALTEEGAGYLQATTLPALPAERTYQLWAVTDVATISLGTFAGGTTVVPFQVAGSVRSFAVTEEEGGGVAVTRHDPLLAGSTS